MPCSCGQKVERAQPKVQCAKCNELFHLQCVGILPADLEFLMNSDKSFFCNVCAAVRRKSIRSPPPPAIDAITTNSIVVTSNSSNSSNLKSVVSLNQSDNFSESNNNQQVTLQSIYNLLVSLRSENDRVHNLISDIHEDNSKLVIKTENMHSDILSMQRNLLEKDNAISLLTAEVNNLRSYISVAMEKFGAPLSSADTNDLSSASNAWSSAASHSHGEISTPTVVVSTAALSSTTAATRAIQSTHTYAKISAPADAVSNAALLPTTGVSVEISAPAATGSSTSGSLPLPAATFTNAQRTTVNKKRNEKQVQVVDVPAEISTLAASESSTSCSLPLPAAVVSNTQWTTVNKKRNKKQLRVVGTNTCKDLDVAVKYKWLHLASFSPAVSEDDIKDYVFKHTGLNKNTLSCFKLIKKGVSLTSIKRVNFKLGVPAPSYEKLLNSDIWPTNVTVKQFRFFPKGPQDPLPA